MSEKNNKKNRESDLPKVFGKDLNTIIADLEFANQFQLLLIDYLYTYKTFEITPDQVESLKEKAVVNTNSKYGFQLLVYNGPQQKPQEESIVETKEEEPSTEM